MGEKLKNPPLIEALCQFVFHSESGSSTPWDSTIPGRLHDRIRDDFPDRDEVHRPEIEMPIVEKDKVIGSHVGPELVQLKRKDMSAIIQVGKNILIVNQLELYPGWEKFQELIIKILRQFIDIANPGKIANLGLRYINRIPIRNSMDFRIDDFLNETPPFTLNEDHIIKKFFQQYELSIKPPIGTLIHKTGLNIIDGQRFLMLDLDFPTSVVEHQVLRDENELAAWLDDVHEIIYKAFVTSLNPELFERMKRGEL